MTSRPFRCIAALAFAATLSVTAFAQETPPTADPVPAPAPTPSDTEEIIVTGSYIKGTPENAALPVDVTSFDDLQEQGAPSIAELVRNLAYTSGNLAETNQFGAGGGGQAQEGVLTVNLRGLGSARTLVLINGRRLAPSDAVGSDLSILPKSAIGRLEVLKDGAAALYGSDAIGGVANFITRENFEGFEISASEQFVRKSNGDHEVAAIAGWGNDRLHLMAAFEWSHRSELRFRDRGWGLIPEPLNPQGGWSSIANPARILPATPGTPTTAGSIIGAGAADPQCAFLGGAVSGPACRFQYTHFDNLTEEQDNYKAYVEANYEFSDSMKLHIEGLYGLMDMPNWKSSPSYPPQSLFGPDRFIAPTHPGLIDFKAQNPTFFPTLFGIPGSAQGAYALSRAIGVAGRPPNGSPLSAKRRTEQWRFVARLTGELFDTISWETAFTYSERERLLDGEDTRTESMAWALDGLGGAGCNPATGTPGVGPCEYFNPFSNAIQRSAINGAVNPQYNAAVANSPALLDWLIGDTASVNTNKLFVWDGVLSGQLPWFSLPGGEMGWAFGAQVRREVYDLSLADTANLAVEPCAFSNPLSVTTGNISQANFDLCQNGIANVTGPFSFLSGTREQYLKRAVWALFGELTLPFHETVDAQFALRYEDYGGKVGSTVDPKLSLRFQPLEWVTLRGSVSTTFRGPPQSFLANRITTLQFIPPTNAFKAVDVVGNPDLKPESALTSNVGLVLEWEGLYASVDYWRFNFTDPFQTESAGQIVGAYTTIGGTGAAVPAGHAAGCQTTLSGGFVGWGVDPANPNADPARCAGIRNHIAFAPAADIPANLVRVDTNIINGSRIRTSGLDFYLQYEWEMFGSTFAVGSTGSYRLDYTSKDFVDIAGFLLQVGADYNGFLNDNASPFQPLPELKTDTFVKFSRGTHTAQIIGHYVTSYTDQLPPRDAALNVINGLDRVDSFFTVDMHYVVRLFDESMALSFSMLNAADKTPPLAGTDLNYDPFTHDGRGRMFKVGLTYTWSPE